MGFSISWLATQDLPKSDVLDRLNLSDGGEADEANESPISGAQLPTGWYVIFLNDIGDPLIGSKSLKKLSKGCAVIGCHVEEHVMFSASFQYSDGKEIWTVSHESSRGLYHLEIFGEPPSFVAEIHADAKKTQVDEGGENAGVDYIFDVPLHAVERLCGYRHDRWKFDWGEPHFTELIRRK